ncbi:hypothetical protein GCM10011380_14180 [Sphingomonas metalli]|uniref:Uncharacterized protein n=1 Tax=Sphingomonas metalli TaxID=1779358 RepID=A0A916T176_9SPHN|nr:hypothetical protein [Sphingomonas metalli]GGB25770.1 hypothetical protein GCM10011380_14180 [Sphingomonas metalli]
MNGWIKKAGLGAVMAATALTAAAPADAQRWGGYYHRRGGDATASALLGGIVGLGVGAAIASSNRDRYYDRGYYDRGYYDRRSYYDVPPPPVYRERYYYDDYRPRCWTEYRRDGYYGGRVPVRVCN